MAVNQYLAWAIAGGANVLTPSAYAALSALGPGVGSGIASSAQANTTWRQPTVAAAAIAQFVCDTTGVDMSDDGSVSNYETKFINALIAEVGLVLASGAQPVREAKNALSIVSGVVTVDFNLGNFFDLLINANITSWVFVNVPAAGKLQEITIRMRGNGTTFTVAWPSSFKWLGPTTAGGTAPTLAFTTGYKNYLVLVGGDGVTTAYDVSYSGTSTT